MVIGQAFPRGSWDGASRDVIFEGGDGVPALTLRYQRDGGLDVLVSDGFLADGLDALVARVETALADCGREIFRVFCFARQPTVGFFRREGDWQILPAPDAAPRVEFQLADHPFVLEVSVPRTRGTEPLLAMRRRDRRVQDTRLVLSLLVAGGVKDVPTSSGSRWNLREDAGTFVTEWTKHGYVCPGFVHLAEDFTDPTGMTAIALGRSPDCLNPTALGLGEPLALPDVTGEVFDRVGHLAPEDAMRFRRACYWIDRARLAWGLSFSMSFAAIVAAVETLTTRAEEDACPACGNDRSPGSSALFQAFFDDFLPGGLDRDDRRRAYDYRSRIVHGDVLALADVDGGLGPFDPGRFKEGDLWLRTLTATRVATLNWLLNRN